MMNLLSLKEISTSLSNSQVSEQLFWHDQGNDEWAASMCQQHIMPGYKDEAFCSPSGPLAHSSLKWRQKRCKRSPALHRADCRLS